MKVLIKSENKSINLDHAILLEFDPDARRLIALFNVQPPAPRPDASEKFSWKDEPRVQKEFNGEDAVRIWNEYNKDALVVEGDGPA